MKDLKEAARAMIKEIALQKRSVDYVEQVEGYTQGWNDFRETLMEAECYSVLEQALAELDQIQERLESDSCYILPKETMTQPATESFERFLNLTKHGAKFIDIRVRKDGKEYEFQADFLKYMKPQAAINTISKQLKGEE